jgi:hypothetical protein
MQEKLLDDMITKGHFRTKNEAIRVALLELGKTYGIYTYKPTNGENTEIKKRK